jgi:alpha-L-fucosidase
MLRLQQQQQMLLQSKLDRMYDDRLSDVISDELWTTKSGELQEELKRVRAAMERHEGAGQAYETAGLQILELAKCLFVVRYEKCAGTGASRENRCIELHVRSRKSFTDLH